MASQSSKQGMLSVFTALILLVIFNSIFFTAVKTEGSPSVWPTYGFMTLAIIFPMIFSTFKFHKMEVKMRAVTNSIIYCILEIIAGIIILICAPQSMTWPIIIQGTILGIVLVMQMSCLTIDSQE